ncbi:hypothetical protein [Anaerophilus nitritogenes]|uniref:hypothetical protein n=1 Tax=Anaerophilus nitritogenes TaxID=2498136 RepID=UPI00101DAECB|nr:hypothetical protein [Anaerophilus nitritogenes]
MTILERLKIELNNKDYFTDAEYTMFLSENDLDAEVEYDKEKDQIQLLQTVVQILEAVSNDIDLMRRVETEFQTTSDAMKWLEKRIDKINKKIEELENAKDEEYSPFTLLFTRN